MAITSLQTATAGSIADLVSVVKSHIAASRYPSGSLVGVQATIGWKTQYLQVVAAGGTAVTDYDIVIASDRAEFTIKINAKITAGFQPLGDISVIQVTPGRSVEYALAFVKPAP